MNEVSFEKYKRNCNLSTHFFSDFDSGNLKKVEVISDHLNVTKDLCGNFLLKFNIMNMNKQMKLYAEGMAPVYKVVPEMIEWKRISTKPTFHIKNRRFILSFIQEITCSVSSFIYFAFTYPYTFFDLQNYLKSLDYKYKKLSLHSVLYLSKIYYHKEVLCYSLEGRNIELLTVTSFDGISSDREPRFFPNLFPSLMPRPYIFHNKKIIFLSARVHPGETPSSFILEGFLNFLCDIENTYASQLRKKFVFKIIPMLNPDGVYNGYYRTDTRGVNLNRVYNNPCPCHHPSVFAAKLLMLYYHDPNQDAYSLCQQLNIIKNICRSTEDLYLNKKILAKNKSFSCPNISLYGIFKVKKNSDMENTKLNREISDLCDMFQNVSSNCSDKAFINNCNDISKEFRINIKNYSYNLSCSCVSNKNFYLQRTLSNYNQSMYLKNNFEKLAKLNTQNVNYNASNYVKTRQSKLFLYIDLHSHATKKGAFVYGNYFDDEASKTECHLFPKLMEANSPFFDFSACNFSDLKLECSTNSKKQTYLNKNGSGRIAIFKAIGLIRCYTFECNYNGGYFKHTAAFNGDDYTSSFQQFDVETFFKIGEHIAKTIWDMNHGCIPTQVSFKNDPSSKQCLQIKPTDIYLKSDICFSHLCMNTQIIPVKILSQKIVNKNIAAKKNNRLFNDYFSEKSISETKSSVAEKCPKCYVPNLCNIFTKINRNNNSTKANRKFIKVHAKGIPSKNGTEHRNTDQTWSIKNQKIYSQKCSGFMTKFEQKKFPERKKKIVEKVQNKTTFCEKKNQTILNKSSDIKNTLLKKIVNKRNKRKKLYKTLSKKSKTLDLVNVCPKTEVLFNDSKRKTLKSEKILTPSTKLKNPKSFKFRSGPCVRHKNKNFKL